MYDRQNSIGHPMETTCNWLQNHDSYRAWLQLENAEEHQGLLYIKGKPGSGKSTLMKAAADRLLTQPGMSMPVIASFFFSGKGSELERSAVGFLRSMTYQLVIVDQNIRQDFLDMFHSTIDDLPGPSMTAALVISSLESESATWQKEQLIQFLRKVYDQPCAPRTIWFVDALDECVKSDAREVVYFLRLLTMLAYMAGNSLQVCLSGRKYGAVTVDKCPEILVEHFNTGDIYQYVRNNFSIAGVIEGQDSARLERLIVQRSSGIFLWVKLVVDLLLSQLEQGASMQSLEVHLQDVPEALEELCAEILKPLALNSPEHRSISVRLFQWAFFTLEPLRLREWHHILAFIRTPPPQSLRAWKVSEFYTGNEEDLDHDKLERQLRHFSRGLLEVRSKNELLSETDLSFSMAEERASVVAGAGSMDMEQGETRLVRVIHESVREFFLHKGGLSILDSALCMPDSQLGNLSIMGTCLDYI